jgi:hypothetical protein
MTTTSTGLSWQRNLPCHQEKEQSWKVREVELDDEKSLDKEESNIE